MTLRAVKTRMYLSAHLDAVRCAHSGRWFLQEYRADLSSRESESFDSFEEAQDRYASGDIVWGEWE